VFHFTGQLDAYSEKQFMEYVVDVLKASTLPAVIDLSKIDFLDSSGLGALVQLAKQCTDAKRSFSLVGNSRVMQTVKLVRLEEFLHLAQDLPTALSNLAAWASGSRARPAATMLPISVRCSWPGWGMLSGSCTSVCDSVGRPVALMCCTVPLLPKSAPRLRLRPLGSLIPC